MVQDEVLQAPAPAPPPAPALATDPSQPNPIIKRVSGEIKRGEPVPRPIAALQAEGPPAVVLEAPSDVDLLTDQLAREARPAMEKMLGQIEAMVGAARSLEELREMLLAGFPKIEAGELSDLLAQAMLAGDAGGRLRVLAEESDD